MIVMAHIYFKATQQSIEFGCGLSFEIVKQLLQRYNIKNSSLEKEKRRKISQLIRNFIYCKYKARIDRRDS